MSSEPATFTQEYDAMKRALALAASAEVPTWPNPRVGCVLVAPDGTIVGEGHHRGAGTPHAEVEALGMAGERAHGATAVVTLEPCNHTGRTGPCTEALIAAGVQRVVLAQRDPSPVAGGGLEVLAAAGIETDAGLLADEARALNPSWTFAHEQRRPFVTWKFAVTLDGRVAARDGSSQWISSEPARRDSHRLRAACDTILVGTNTAEVDDPRLTARDEDGNDRAQQPLRVVLGERELASDLRVLDDSAPSLHLRTRDPQRALHTLYAEHDRHHVFLEGGPTVAAAFVKAGVIDEVVTYVAPMLLGAGQGAVAKLGIENIADALTFNLVDATVVGEGPEANVRLVLRPSVATGRGESN